MQDFTTLDELEWNLSTYFPELKEIMDKPPIENPFKSSLRLGILDRIKMVFLCILVPFRLMLLGIALLLAYLTAYMFQLGVKETTPPTPLKGIAKVGQSMVYGIARICLFSLGYHHIRIIGNLTPETRVIVATPHSSFIDSLVITLIGEVSVVTRKENLQHCFFGRIMSIFQPVPVSRDDKNSRVDVIKEIKRRAYLDEWPPVVLFPEGTCTNRKSYIHFKPGAFYPGLPVQPVILRYKDRLDYATWTWIGSGAFRLTMIMMCQLWSTVEIEILPTYTPTKEEIDEPLLYARNVRDYIAKVDGLTVTDHSFEDCLLMREAENLGMPMEVGLVEYYKLSKLVGINCDFMLEQLQRFCAIDMNYDGFIDIDEFCDFLNLPPTDDVCTMFRIYDLHDSNGISFRDFMIGEFLITKRYMTDENMQDLFDMFKPRPDRHLAYITLPEFVRVLKRKMDIYDECIGEIFSEMDGKDSGCVYYEQFKEFCTSKPPYVLLFMHFQGKCDIEPREEE